MLQMTSILARTTTVTLLVWLCASSFTPPAAFAQVTPPVPATAHEAGGAEWRVADRRPIDVAGEPAALSPDGQWIAGTGNEGEFCVWAVDTLEPACEGAELEIRPETITWAPDSSAVAFALNAIQLFVDSDLYVFEIEDEELRNLTDDGYEEAIFLEESEEPYPVDDVPAWSPDGTELVFARTYLAQGADNSTTLMRIARDGGEPETVHEIRPAAPLQVYAPMHWLDDDQVLFSIITQDLSDDANGVWTVGLDGSEPRHILSGSAADVPGPWVADISPDGRMASIFSLVNRSTFAPEDVYFLLDLETGATVPMRTDEEPEEQILTPPRFSPDGTLLIYAVSGAEGNDDVVSRDVATGEHTVLAGGAQLGGAGFSSTTLTLGIDWADNDTVLLSGMLLTLERA